MQFKEAELFVKDKLRRELADNLFYHSIHHTDDVMQAALFLAEKENVSEYETNLLRTAVVLHDSGFTIYAKDHEMLSCNIAKEHLPDFGYTHEEIERICRMIMATRIPQTPNNHLEEIICDSDLDYLGRDDYDSISNTLYMEINTHGKINEKNWLKIQIDFLEKHHYFTKTAKNLRDEKKKLKLEMLKLKYEQMH